MSFTEIDQIIEENLEKLHEEKYKLRTFQVELLLKIQSTSLMGVMLTSSFLNL